MIQRKERPYFRALQVWRTLPPSACGTQLRAMVPGSPGQAKSRSFGPLLCRNSKQLDPQGAESVESGHSRPSSRNMFNQMARNRHSHVLVLPDVRSEKSTTVLADAGEASTLYFVSLLDVIFELNAVTGSSVSSTLNGISPAKTSPPETKCSTMPSQSLASLPVGHHALLHRRMAGGH